MNPARLFSIDHTFSPAARFTRMSMNCTGYENQIVERNTTPLKSAQSSGPSSPMASINRLPNELVLNICNYLSPAELWFNARPVSRQFYSCAKEVLVHKCFHEEQVRFSRCCFWCSLGHSSLEAALKTITPLFRDKRKLYIDCISDQALLAKIVFGELCNTVARAEQKINICVGDAGEEVTTTAAEWLRYMERLPRDVQQRRHGFIAFYFARVGRKTTEWRIRKSLGLVTHVLSFVVVGTLITVVAVSVLFVGGIVWETFRVAKVLWRLLDRLVEVCVPDRLLRD
jgi:hypothetical protein